jgi:hypothetical protein
MASARPPPRPAFLAKQTLSATGLRATINDTLATVSGRDKPS